MHVSVAGRVDNISLRPDHGLRPLFEAIVNSIDSIDEAGGDPLGHRIDVRILRRRDLLAEQQAADAGHTPIEGFEVEDDGPGFTEANFAAFNEADTRAKADRGGKGVGRFLWLKAFERASVDSVYRDKGALWRRAFTFSLRDIADYSLERASDEAAVPRTVVRLAAFKDPYEKAVRDAAASIARRIVEHCLARFVLKQAPRILLHDDLSGEILDLAQVCEDLTVTAVSDTLIVDDQRIDVRHFLLSSSAGGKHRISYCAGGRVVKEAAPGSKIPNLSGSHPLATPQGDAYYAAYVTSDYLDEHVNQERTDFATIPTGEPELFGAVTWPRIEEQVLQVVRRFVHPYTQAVREEKQRRVREYVATKAPQYRCLVAHHPDRLDEIPPEPSDHVLDSALHKIEREIDEELDERGRQLLSGNDPKEDGPLSDAEIAKFQDWWSEYNESGKASLAKYIVRRRVALMALERALRRRPEGAHYAERVAHSIIFPLQSTSDDVSFEQHNLWLLDERLAYHRYLASDVRLASIPGLETDDGSRPDLVAFFDRPLAVVDGDAPFSSGIVVFEFKRPMRDAYSAQENPVAQVYTYVEKIREGTTQTRDGRPLVPGTPTPFCCYIVADITQSLRTQAVQHGLMKTPDGLGYFGYNQGLNAYTEVLSYDKLVQDATKRNRILFEKLGLRGPLSSEVACSQGGGPLAGADLAGVDGHGSSE